MPVYILLLAWKIESGFLGDSAMFGIALIPCFV
jgi:hypothetical protein